MDSLSSSALLRSIYLLSVPREAAQYLSRVMTFTPKPGPNMLSESTWTSVGGGRGARGHRGPPRRTCGRNGIEGR